MGFDGNTPIDLPMYVQETDGLAFHFISDDPHGLPKLKRTLQCFSVQKRLPIGIFGIEFLIPEPLPQSTRQE